MRFPLYNSKESTKNSTKSGAESYKFIDAKHKLFIIKILQVITIMHAIQMGWTVDYIGSNKLILSKKLCQISNLENFNLLQTLQQFISQ